MNNPQTKICTKCNIEKELSEFYYRNDTNKYKNACKECVKTKSYKNKKTKQGVITDIYGKQKANSRERGHPQPSYSNKQLSEWLLKDWLFNLLYNNWANCGYKEKLKPSVDRLDDKKHYTLDNIQIMTWEENRKKACFHKRIGLLGTSSKRKPVAMYTKEKKFIKSFMSTIEASRQTGVQRKSISMVCRGKFKFAGGFVWKYIE